MSLRTHNLGRKILGRLRCFAIDAHPVEHKLCVDRCFYERTLSVLSHVKRLRFEIKELVLIDNLLVL